ncbi:hypothetical protein AJ79_10092 [Helicocarpus griseus UAMH5409]|uniref:Nucleoside phosphorylase domain-containing protein n=1 Tax=Helicocarpus griseus UAMH5409 TaxID=1447875 RepID=A0A2B7WFK1_9EURO|nr:hypothetical protein AJ79_10092 [Helicocarpus griseus UAMH5409]
MRGKPRICKDYDDYTVAVVCANEFERDAVRYMLDEEHIPLPIKPGDSNLYFLGELSRHNVVLACLPGNGGKSSAARVASDIHRSFLSVEWIFVVGTGRGVASERNDIRRGDVVVSMPEGQYGGVVQYDLGKELEHGFQTKGFLHPPPAIVRSAVQVMRSDHRIRPNMIGDFVAAMVEEYPDLAIYRRPAPESDVLFHSDYYHVPSRLTCDICDKTKAVVRPARKWDDPVIHYGLVGSGDKVMESAAKSKTTIENIGDILCFETEAAGVATDFPCIVIRGISDYADSHKNSSWQHYAAAAAAGCTKELLSKLPSRRLAPMETPISLLGPGMAKSNDYEQFAWPEFNRKGIQCAEIRNLTIGRNLSLVKR